MRCQIKKCTIERPDTNNSMKKMWINRNVDLNWNL